MHSTLPHMLFLCCFALLLSSSLVPVRVRAAEIVLQERAAIRASVVRLCDVAGVAGADSAAVLQLADTPLMPTPAPGIVSYLRVAELRDLLAARGLDLRGVTFSGADYVAISRDVNNSEKIPKAETPAVSKDLAVADQRLQSMGMAATLEDELAAAERLTAAISDYLRQQTGHELWKVQVEADPPIIAAFLAAGPNVTISGGKEPWSGRQRFTIVGAGEPTTFFARIDRMEPALFALRSINRGDLVRRGDVELRPHIGALPANALTSPEAAIGKEAVQAIRADSMLAANQVRRPTIVRRNERVSVRARAAGVTVRTFAIAQQDGSLGDLVTVQPLDSKDRYAARVVGLRELEVMAAGVSAADVAAVAR